MNLNKAIKSVVCAFAVLGGLFTTGCTSYQMSQNGDGTNVTSKSVDGHGVGSAAAGIGRALTGVADIVDAANGHHRHAPRPGIMPPPPRPAVVVVPPRPAVVVQPAQPVIVVPAPTPAPLPPVRVYQ